MNSELKDYTSAINPPSWLRRLSLVEYEATHARFWSRCRKEGRVLWNGKCTEMIIPNRNLEIRAIPFGILPLEGHAEILDAFFDECAGGGVDVWAPDAYFYGTFRGRYCQHLREWVADALPFGTHCILAVDLDLLVIAEKDFAFSLVAGSRALINNLEERLGGAHAMRNMFVEHLESAEFGAFREGAPEWGATNILPLCGW